ncbi:MAG TPA: sulfotransferase [Gemmata sp.]|jgi:hypothetical protein|nr:sulfotransferase [Gemmata sp.]
MTSGNKSSAIGERRQSRQSPVDKESPFYVPTVLDLLGGLVNRFPRPWLWFGNLESSLLASEIVNTPVVKPIYVCGLARSGSTLLHEILSSHPGVATHRIKDYPFVSTPYWWRRAIALARPTEARERPHRDKMMVTSDSPDAIEEMLWMAFFPGCHNPNFDNRLESRNRNSGFDTFYFNHIRKLLLVEKATRYAAKANYHVARLPYILRLFPDAKFVIPIRTPAGHIASLVRQHEWFSSGHRQSPKSLAFMQRSGHFEFGRDRRPINLGDRNRVKVIQDAWASGNEILGWSYYWDMVYRYLAQLLDSNEAIRKASIVVRFEELCDHPAAVLQSVLKHCELPDATPILEKFAPAIHRPDYYKSPLTSEELAIIQSQTAGTVRHYQMMSLET